MIKIERDGQKVKIRIEHNVYYNENEIWAYCDCGNELFAELLSNQIRTHLEKRIQAIRKEEYDKGYKDAKAKVKKEDWFSGVLKLYMTQNQHLIKWLTPRDRTITPMQALRKFNCWSLSSRMSNIKDMGYPIVSEMVTDKRTGKRFARYYFK